MTKIFIVLNVIPANKMLADCRQQIWWENVSRL